MAYEQTEKLLSAGLRGDHVGIAQLVEATGGFPLIAKQINGILRGEVDAGRRLDDAVAEVLEEFRKDGPRAFDVASENHRQQAVSVIVERGLRGLARQTNGKDLTDLFLDLAVFKEDALVPLSVLARWWQRTLFAMRALARELANFRLVTYDAHDGTLQLHDVVAPASSVTAGAKRSWSNGTGRWYKAGCAVPSTPGLACRPDEPYAWWALALHLHAAGRDQELLDALVDVGFLAGQAHVIDPLAVEGDFAMVAGMDPDVDSVATEYSLAAHLLWPLTDPTSIAATLAPRLTRSRWEPDRPYLRPLTRLPDLPHPALKRVLLAAAIARPALTWSPNGEVVATAFAESALLLSASTGELLERYAFDGEVTDVEWSPGDPCLAVTVLENDDDWLEEASPPSGRCIVFFLTPGADVHHVTLEAHSESTGALTGAWSHLRARASWCSSGRRGTSSSRSLATVRCGSATTGSLPPPTGRCRAGTCRTACSSAGATSATPWSGSNGAPKPVWSSSWDNATASSCVVGRTSAHVEFSTAGAVLDAVASPLEPMAATVDVMSHVSLWRLTDLERQSTVDTRWDSVLFWSPTGDAITTFGEMGIRLWDTARLAASDVESSRTIDTISVDWHPSGESLWSAHRSEVREWSPDGQLRRVQPGGASSLMWSPDGRCLALADEKELRLQFIDATVAGRYERTADSHLVWAWAADSSALRVAEFVGPSVARGRVLSVAGVVELAIPPGIGDVADARWSASGELLVLSGAGDGTGLRVMAVNVDGASLLCDLDDVTPTDVLALMPDDERVLTMHDDCLAVWNMTDGSMIGEQEAGEAVVMMAGSDDGERLAVVTLDGIVSVLGRNLEVLHRGRAGLASTVWSPDGRWLASFSEQFEIHTLEVGTGLSLSFAVDDILTDAAWCPGRELLAVAGRAGVYFLAVVPARLIPHFASRSITRIRRQPERLEVVAAARLCSRVMDLIRRSRRASRDA